MAQSFDPYLQWLGIRDPQRPPNHYRLLGLELFESDADVIASAADRQMTHVRGFQSGQHSELSQKILNELAAARVCLLKPDRKAQYDEALKKQVAAKVAKPVAALKAPPAVARAVPAKPAPAVPVVRASDSAVAMAEIAAVANAPSSTAARSRSRQRKTKKSSALPLLAVAVLALVGVMVVAYAMQDGSQSVAKSPVNPDTTTKPIDDNTATKPVEPESNKPDESSTKEPDKPADQPQDKPSQPKDAATSPVDRPGTDESPTENSSDKPTTPSVDDLVTDATEEADDTESPETDEPGDSQSLEEMPEDEPEVPAIIAPPADKRLPVPEKAGQDAALEIIKDLFKSDYTLRKPDERAAFAQKLLAQGKDTTNDATSAYVLFDQAMTIAATAGDAETALDAASQLGELYQVDTFDLKATTLTTLGRTAKTAQAVQAIASEAQTQMEQAIDQDRFDYAKRFNALVLAAVRKVKDLNLVNQSQARLRDIKLLESEYAKVESSFAKLKELPNDPEANLAVGKYLCFVKGDFDHGLPLLAKCSDHELKNLAKAEISKKHDSTTSVQLADRWWRLSENERLPSKVYLRLHAEKLYRLALPDLSGLTKMQVESKLNSIEKESSGQANNKLASSMMQQLIESKWRIIWKGNPNSPVSGHRRNITYESMRFYADGTCESPYSKGQWIKQGDIIIVTYPNQPTIVQKYRLKPNQLECETYIDNDKLDLTGLGEVIH